MYKRQREMMPLEDAKSLLGNQGFDRSISFDNGVLKTQQRSFSPGRVVVLDKIHVSLEENNERANLFALRTKFGLKGILLDTTGEFSKCLDKQCWGPAYCK